MPSMLFTRISAKLTAMSAGGILVVLVLLAAVWVGDASVSRSSDFGRMQLVISRDLVDAKASVRSMMMGMLELRLAQTSVEATKARDYVAKRHESVNKYLESASSHATLQANKDRIAKVIELTGQWMTEYHGLSNTIEARLDRAASPEASKEETASQGKLLGIADQIGSLLDECVNAAKSKADEAGLQMSAASSLALRMCLGMGVLVLATLIASALYGSKAIARPIGRLTASMKQLAHGDLDTAVPFPSRTDEIGDMAGARCRCHPGRHDRRHPRRRYRAGASRRLDHAGSQQGCGTSRSLSR